MQDVGEWAILMQYISVSVTPVCRTAWNIALMYAADFESKSWVVSSLQDGGRCLVLDPLQVLNQSMQGAALGNQTGESAD